MLNLIGPNSPEYEARCRKPFVPTKVTLKQIHEAVPKHLFQRSSITGFLYIARDISFTLLLLRFAANISIWGASDFGGFVSNPVLKVLVKTGLWLTYWWFQGLVWAGFFVLGHDAGHGTLFATSFQSNIAGYLLHTFLLIPYFSWRSTHHAHHKATGSMEKDENYVPYERQDWGLKDEGLCEAFSYAEVFEETPIFTFGKMMVMQFLGWWAYLGFNTRGSKMYPPGTNHFDPDSPLFKKHERNSVVLSNIGLGTMLTLLFGVAGWRLVAWYYLVPYLLTNHWIVMITYLQHSDPTIPHFRGKAWTFVRGAATTVDRPLMGWMGRFFLHNVSHDHVAHHFFIKVPFYNGPQVTKCIKQVLGDDYNYDSTPSFSALHRSFTQCLFVEADGEIVFYKNKEGKAAREVAVDDGANAAEIQAKVDKELVERLHDQWVEEEHGAGDASVRVDVDVMVG